MAASRSTFWPIVTVVIALLVGTIALPQSMRRWAPSFLQSPQLHYGLDLAGGTQLDFRISEVEMEEQLASVKKQIAELEAQNGSSERIALLQNQVQAIDAQRSTIVESIRTVLERRINSMGVSEAIITPSYIGSEKHLLVECPGVVDTQTCINTVGKTIQLEFKEEFTEPTKEYEDSVRQRANAALKSITASGKTLSAVGQDLSDKLGVAFIAERAFYRDELPDGLETLWNAAPGSGVKKIEGVVRQPEVDEKGQVTEREIPGIFIAEVTKPRTQSGRLLKDISEAFIAMSKQQTDVRYKKETDRVLDSSIPDPLKTALGGMTAGEMRVVTIGPSDARLVALRSITKGTEQMEASHILLSYSGALSAEKSVTRSKLEAQRLAQEVKKKLDAGENFTTLARTLSDGPSAKKSGILGLFGRGTMVPAFEEVAFSLPKGSISDPVETPFGYHIIRADSAPTTAPDTATFDEIIVSGAKAVDRANGFSQLLANGVKSNEDVAFIRALFFSLIPTGWKDTELNGEHFRAAAVTLDQVSNLPIVQISFDEKGAQLFQELTKKNVGKRIAIFVGGEIVSAPTVQGEISGGVAVITGSKTFEEAKTLAQDLNTGAIPAPIYLSGQRTIEATLGAEALFASAKAAIIGIIAVMLYMILLYKLFGVLANIALGVYAAILLAIVKLPLLFFSHQYIVLTIAGVAGILLSIGMAVDANVLIFERTKEELKKGKLLKTAVALGFQRAWPSIRDGNISTLITCAILFIIGTSIVRGFAITLSMGVVTSLFTAIIVTRWLVERVISKPWGERWILFGIVKRSQQDSASHA
ncbi:TPA: protein translocase subunit SecD [Candidatus Peribacteria bacterium]|nr:MAG: protein-export membrane protein SecD [Candidatus Peribacteria bacterium RIFOXYC2_FULL_58_10]HAI98270.1 protein translocase subunit SecD [Candidatus Peribacteria bacterium]HAS34447.1 protein translocase subunit SecD [Candidatus Peribacteria bacterium]